MPIEEIILQAKDALPWEIFWWIVGFIATLLLKIPQAIWMAPKILKQNRTSLGNGSGKRLADIFLHSWYKPLGFNTIIQTHDILIPSGQTTQNMSVENASNILNKLNLTESSNNELKAVKNIRNHLVFYICIFWLVVFNGDTVDYYRKLKHIT